MDRFAELKTFCTVASSGGFSSAARQLGLATSSVTRVIDALEGRLGVALLNRSTRSVTLTEAGRGYLEDALRILDQLEAADDAVSERGDEVKGVLRVAAPPAFAAQYIAPMLPDLRVRHPRLVLDLCLSNEIVSLADESIDVAIRISSIDPDARLVARRLAAHERILCVSPAYIKRHGAPLEPSDLARHDCLQFSFSGNRRSWRMRRKDSPEAAVEDIPIRGVVQADNADVLRQAAIAGLGLAMLANWMVRADLAEGRLVRVLDGYDVNPGPMDVALYAVYQENRRGSQKIRAFVELLAQHLARAGIA